MSCQEVIEFNVLTDGAFLSSCPAVQRGSAYYAQYFTFFVPDHVATETPTGVLPTTVSLEAGEDTYLYLLAGPDMDSPLLQEDDDGGAGVNSKIIRDLAPGYYTAECTTYSRGTTGAFTLLVSASVPQEPQLIIPRAPDDMFQQEQEVTGRLSSLLLLNRVNPYL